MKASLEQLDNTLNSSLLFRQFSLPYFDAPYHFHPEFELTLIQKSQGKRFVGTNIANFKEGDLVLLGPNLPHCWKNDGIGLEGTAQSVVVQFKENFLGDSFFQTPEMSAIQRLLKSAECGVVISGKTRDRIAKEIYFLLNVPPVQKILGLIDILNTIAISSDYSVIDAQAEKHQLASIDLERINKVYAYIIENYTQEVHLEMAAFLANMTETAFCRYFKKVTKKTFLDLVTEFRIKHACNLLTQTDKQVAEVCFESGFGNVSHFNKQFKSITGQSPLGYRKLFQKL
ncbi:AraC family transcriptional regulator [Flectobacillus major]|jgi:AraC-like DNA-binding protein|uniref:AraC family transcriptional regulator n=1 Tax=Flectobacillus major TaxID=103 RepID=UPI00041C05C2|nr:AraC family transcriptional regulator [Flectobacillus major]